MNEYYKFFIFWLTQSKEMPLQDFLAPWFAVSVQQYFPANKNDLVSLYKGISQGRNYVINLSLPHCLLLQQQEHQSPILPQFRSLRKSDKRTA